MATIPEAFALAVQHHQAGQLQAAEQICRQILAADPNHADAPHLLGVMASQTGRQELAVDFIQRAIGLRGSEAVFHINLGNAFHALGKPSEAIASYHRALELKPDFVVAHFNLGNALKNLGRLDEAVASYRRALELKPDFHDAYHNLGRAFQAKGNLVEAVASFRRTLELKPDHPEAYNNLGNALWAQGKLAEAVDCYRKALGLKPEYAEAYSNLANALQVHGKLEAAVAFCRRALDLKPGYAEAHNNLGNALQAQGQLDEAARSYRQAIDLKPDFAEAHNNLSMLLLQRGDFERGWNEYEWRWKTWQHAARQFAVPSWNGEPLTEKTILLHAEQGLGDTIQFVRYAAMVKDLGATVVVECQKPLVKLLASCPGIDQLVGRGSGLPQFDFHAPLMSLPRILKTDIATIPGCVPYLFADSELVAQWRETLGDMRGFRVAINWRGEGGKPDAAGRAVPLGLFSSFAQVPGVRLISVHKGVGQGELVAAGDSLPVANLGEAIDTTHGAFMDTAAIMKVVDLVITTDTATAHLAGSLGVPVWVALPLVPDWRWLLGRSDSPWYPTMRLFRQTARGDWKRVFDEISVELHRLTARQL